MAGVVERLRTIIHESGAPEQTLVVVSRFIERRALGAGDGVLRSTFQRLSRLGRESGTRAVYQRLAQTDLSVHVYGRDDWDVPETLTVETHTGYPWCVVFRPPADSDPHAALLALETGSNEWVGTWTYDAGRVRRIERVLVEAF